MKVYVVLQSMYNTEVIAVFKSEDDAQTYIRDLEISNRDHGYKGCHYFYQEFDVEE